MKTHKLMINMDITFKNIGKIKHASIGIEGLTVITGENDTGKSMIGKSIYALIHGLNNQKNVSNEDALQKTFEAEFQSVIFPTDNADESKILITDKETPVFSCVMDNGHISKAEKFKDMPFQDATIIESTVILQFYDMIHRQISGAKGQDKLPLYTLALQTKIPYHIHDLIQKIEQARKYIEKNRERNTFDNSALQDISHCIDGSFSIKNKHSDIFFTKENKQEIQPLNTASGVKAFGILQILIQASMLNKNNLIIIDEPENHLHPKWQVIYAKLIVDLVKNKIPVFISSHSPYMIQALNYYSRKEKTKIRTLFYSTEKNTGSGVTVNNISDDLNQIFAKLAEPLKELVWK